MRKLRYACAVTGADPDEVAAGHRSLRTAVSIGAVAMHVPVCGWGAASFVVARTLYEVDLGPSVAIAASAAAAIYCIERVVWGLPLSRWVTAGRFGLGVLVACTGALLIDLCMFQPEVREQLAVDARQAQVVRLDGERAGQAQQVLRLEQQARDTRARADCELAGTCGTRQGGPGRVWQQLDRQARAAEAERVDTVRKAQALDDEKSALLKGDGPPVDEQLRKSGLLARIAALHRYAQAHPAAAFAWATIFLLLCCSEFLVVAAKLALGKPLDEKLAEMREQLALREAAAYLEALRSRIPQRIER